MAKPRRCVRYGPYHIGREFMKNAEEKAKRMELASRGIKPPPIQLSIPWAKGDR